ncbi:Ribosomal protein S18 [Plasmodium coatneyi]|uniref:Ribosomal protein S18 n=1 Tax=Plasmodium coatneyi TaxID=208452 RepID=A0A1B1DUG7_9APIC|nr:Ribosomal protein S18 [Plasmodium coatneyi]ANQ06420.1 Ribosomal protein S18 [Plasmodium coatneyi]
MRIELSKKRGPLLNEQAITPVEESKKRGRLSNKSIQFRLHSGSKNVKQATSNDAVKPLSATTLEDIKVSKETSSNALFDECLEEIYRKKKQVDKNSVEYDVSPVIEELSREEIKLTRDIFKRIDEKKKNISHLNYKDIYIDPYWNPFKEVTDMRREIVFEFSEYTKVATMVEVKKQRRSIKRSLKEQYRLYNPYSGEYSAHIGLDKDSNSGESIVCNDKSEKYWNPGVDRKKLLNLRCPFIWRHTHLLHHFIGENGLILPRKINFTTRKQQIQIFKAICVARRMALYPYDRKPEKDDLIPLMDPLQMLADELIHRYVEKNDLRAQAMLKVMINKYPSLNYYKYFCHESGETKSGEAQPGEAQHGEGQHREEPPGDPHISKMLRKYKENYYEGAMPPQGQTKQ